MNLKNQLRAQLLGHRYAINNPPMRISQKQQQKATKNQVAMKGIQNKRKRRGS
jgi:hypothetical protein